MQPRGGGGEKRYCDKGLFGGVGPTHGWVLFAKTMDRENLRTSSPREGESMWSIQIHKIPDRTREVLCENPIHERAQFNRDNERLYPAI